MPASSFILLFILAASVIFSPVSSSSPWALLLNQTSPWKYCQNTAHNPCACKPPHGSPSNVGKGVVCSSSTDAVLEIDLRNFGLQHTLSYSTLYLYDATLTLLNLNDNPDLRGSLPCVPGLPSLCVKPQGPSKDCQLPTNIVPCNYTSRSPTPPRPTISPSAAPSSRAPSTSPVRSAPSASPHVSAPSSSPSRRPSESPTASPTRSCTLRVGLVTSNKSDAAAGAQLAIQAINAGAWASGPQPPGVLIGTDLVCELALFVLDDQGDFSLHNQQVASLAGFVDFFISGTLEAAEPAEALLFTKMGLLAFDCCLPSSNTYPPPSSTTFTIPASDTTSLTDFINNLAFAVPTPRFGLAYNSSSDEMTQICGSALDIALSARNLPMQFVLTFEGPPDLALINESLVTTHCNVLISCFEQDTGAALVNFVTPLGLSAIFVAAGPGVPSFHAALGENASYLTSAAQWHPALKYPDPLFGNTTAFAAKFAPLIPTADAAGAAAAIEVLYQAIVVTGANRTFVNLQDFYARQYEQIIANVRLTNLETVFGTITFDALNRNKASETVTTQLVPSGSGPTLEETLVAVFPIRYTTAQFIYPMPSRVYCITALGPPSVFESSNGSTSSCLTLTSTAQKSASSQKEAVCTDCLSQYQISDCSSDGTQQVFTFPNLQSQACGNDNFFSLCSRYINLSEAVAVTIPCDYAPASSPAGIFLLVSLCVAAVSILAFMFLLVRNRDNKVVQYAQFYPTMACCMGGALMAICGVVFIGPNTFAMCQLRTWLFNLTATVFFTPLFLKVYRVWLIFENPKLSRVVITNARIAKWMASILAVEVLWLIIWTAVSPTRPLCGPAVYPQLAEAVPFTYCGNDQPVFPVVAALFIVLFVLAGVTLAFMTRKVSRFFAEREIIFATLNVTIVGGAVALLYFFAGLSVQLNTVLVGIGLAWCSAFTVLVLLAPKFWIVYNKSEAYVESKAFGLPGGNAPPKRFNPEGNSSLDALLRENETLKQEVVRLKAQALVGFASESGGALTTTVRRLASSRRNSTEGKAFMRRLDSKSPPLEDSSANRTGEEKSPDITADNNNSKKSSALINNQEEEDDKAAEIVNV